MAFLYALLYTIIPFSLGYYNLKELFITKKGILILSLISILSLFVPIYHFLSFSLNLELFYYIVGIYWVGFITHFLFNFKSGFVKNKRRIMYVSNLIFLGLYLNSMPIWNMSKIGNRLSPQSVQNIEFKNLTNTEDYSIVVNKQYAIYIAKSSLNAEITKGDNILKLSSVVEVDEHLTSLQKHNNSYYWVVPLKVSNNTLGYGQYKVGNIPAYLLVDATKENTKAELVRTYQDSTGVENNIQIKLFTDGFYGRNLSRAIKLENPTEIISSFSFKIDENKVPYAIAHVIEAAIGLENYVPKKVIAYNLITNTSEEYSFSNIPSWISSVGDLNTILDVVNDWGLYRNSDITTFFKGTHKVKVNDKNSETIDDDIIMIPVNNGLGWLAEMTSATNENQSITDIIVVDGLSLNVYLKTYKDQSVASSNLVEESIQSKLGKDSGSWTTAKARPYSLSKNNVWIVPIISKKDHSYIKTALVDFNNINVAYIDNKKLTVIDKYLNYNQESSTTDSKVKLILKNVIINNVNLVNQDGYIFAYLKLKNADIYKNAVFSCNASNISTCLVLDSNENIDMSFVTKNREQSIFEIKEIQYSEIKNKIIKSNVVEYEQLIVTEAITVPAKLEHNVVDGNNGVPLVDNK